MRIGLVLVLVVGIATAVWVAASKSADSESAAMAGAEMGQPEPGAGVAPVVVELFTSQGCSSCPPADALLASIGSDPAYGDRVVALSYHVDYWNRIGWEDPFSAAAWTQRQHDYGRVLRLGNVYTPQAIVNGSDQFVGSDRNSMKRAIADAAAPVAEVAVSATLAGGEVKASVNAKLTGSVDAAEYFVYVALTEREITTKVLRGENSGRTLVNDHVVRRLERPIRLIGRMGSQGDGDVKFDLDPSWKADRLEVVAFVQDPDSMRIVGAAKSRVQ